MSEIRTSDPQMGKLVVYTATQTNFYPRSSLTSIRATGWLQAIFYV